MSILIFKKTNLSIIVKVIYRVVARRPRVKGSSNSHRRDSTMAVSFLSLNFISMKKTQALLTTIVLAFVITNSLRVGINIYEAYMVRNITYLSLSLGHRSDTNAKIYISLSFLHLMKI